MTDVCDRAVSKPKIVYVDYEFPSLTTTFTWREVAHLLEVGYEVEVLSMRCPDEALLHPNARVLAALTTYVGRPGTSTCLGALVRLFLRRPTRVLSALGMLLSPVHPVGKYPAFVYHLLWAAYATESRLTAGASVVHAPFAAGQGSMALFISILDDIPLWITSHAYDIYCDRIAIRRKLKRADLFVTISRANLEFLRKQYDGDARDVRVFYLGVDPGEIHYEPPTPATNSPRIVSVASLSPKKGHDVLVLACKILRDRGLDLTCEIVGAGPLMEDLHKLVGQLELRDVVALSGPMSNDRAQAVIRSSDVFVLASQPGVRGDRDGIPVALMEAMAAGVPVVSTRISGIPELVVDGVTGLLASPGNPEEIADAIMAAATDEGLRERLSEEGRLHIERYFDQRANTAALAETVCDVIQRSEA